MTAEGVGPRTASSSTWNRQELVNRAVLTIFNILFIILNILIVHWGIFVHEHSWIDVGSCPNFHPVQTKIGPDWINIKKGKIKVAHSSMSCHLGSTQRHIFFTSEDIQCVLLSPSLHFKIPDGRKSYSEAYFTEKVVRRGFPQSPSNSAELIRLSFPTVDSLFTSYLIFPHNTHSH